MAWSDEIPELRRRLAFVLGDVQMAKRLVERLDDAQDSGAAEFDSITPTSGTLTVTGNEIISGDLTVDDIVADDIGCADITSTNGNLTGFQNVAGSNVTAGASGAAGNLAVFPATADKGGLALTCSDQVGNTTVAVNVAAMAAARAISLADPLANADILTGKMDAVARTATADGTGNGTIAAAGLLQFITVTSADANHIVVLPTPTPGRIVILHVAATGYELRTSDPATIGINGGTGASAESAIGANTTVVMICATATSWKGLQLGSDGTLAKVEVAA